MKKLVVILLACMMALSACGSGDNSSDASVNQTAEDLVSSGTSSSDHNAVSSQSGDMIEIEENLFIAQTNDIYINTDDYLGKTVKYEGIFLIENWEETDSTYYYVIRYGPGCCGYDSNAGFEVIWDDESNVDYPEDDEWVEASGILEKYEEDGFDYLRVRLTSLTVLKERGDEYVYT